MCRLFYIIGVMLSCTIGIESARILGVFPIPSPSHHIVFNRYVGELANKGHEVVILMPDILPKEKLLVNNNVTYVYIDSCLNAVMETNPVPKRGVISNIDVIIDMNFYMKFLIAMSDSFNNANVKKIIEDKNQHFDLIIVEGFFEYQLIVSHFFEAPIITIASFMGFPAQYEMMGVVSRHPTLYPEFHRMNYDNLSFWETLRELKYELIMYNMYKDLENAQDELLKKNFGNNVPTVKQLKENVDMLFLTVHPLFANNRPVPPNVIYLEALHLEPVKELPKDLKEYLDNSKRGVVYVSLGSNIHTSMMDKDLLDAFIEFFKVLPYDILWKSDGSDENISKNVNIYKWLPQRDLLHHPNIKAFVTQCGIQSTSEAIDAAVPLVAVPLIAEQWYNAKKVVDFGIGVKLDPLTLKTEDLVIGVKNVLENTSYKENAKRLRDIVNDNPQTPLERAIWWTEYVLRHGGAKHLRTPAANISLSEYYMLDIILPLILAIVVAFIFVGYLLYYVIKTFTGNRKNNIKLKKN